MYPYANTSLITKALSMFKNLKWTEFLDGTQKTLGVINQAIPIVYQVKPLVNNTKTLFKIASAINTPNTNQNNRKIIKEKEVSNNSPIFYL
ncbi:MAG: hypothetical protein IKF37_01290 [Bacilli bacterium]|nr:hypothetical protein [Bacilli bacterium]